MKTCNDQTLAVKEERLKEFIRQCGSMAVAYSGGVDSTYLADVAHEVLGGDAAILIADSPSLPRSEFDEAKQIAQERGWRLTIVKTDEFGNEEYLKNEGMRCYHCRVSLFTEMKRYADQAEIKVLAYGAIVDDLMDPTRVGARAAEEYRVVAPLQEAGLTKEDIRELSGRRGLPTSDKASFACLSSRFPKGTRVNLEDLKKVEQAEETLRRLGFKQYRARHHGDICRIEIDEVDLSRLLDDGVRREILDSLTGAGYRFVTLDLACYRTGSTA